MVYHKHMKTTLDISDNILLRAKKVAHSRKRSLKSIAEEGIMVVLDRLERNEVVEICPVTFGGKGMTREFSGKPWNEVRDAAYEGRGGQ